MTWKAIGIFDSGVGGLTVLKEIVRSLPQEDTIYLGDTARVPYGSKSRETVVRYARQNTELLLDQGIELLVMTSANLADEPLICSNDEVLRKLSGVADALALARELKLALPDIIVFGVQPECVDWSDRLCPQVQAAVPQVIEAVLNEAKAT